LSTTYKVISGDTFEIIARKVYGSEQEADTIFGANPGSTEPLIVGTSLTIPSLPNTPTDKASSAQSSNPNEVALLINNERFRFWEKIKISQGIDKISTIDFSTPFDHEADKFKETFQPLSYKNTTVTVGGDPLFTGTVLPVNPVLQPDRKTMSVTAYATPGVLGDCSAPANAFPLEFNGQTIKEIADKLLKPFGLSAVLSGSAGAVFKKVSLSTGSNILSFLIGLAKQRGLLITDNNLGELLIYELKTDATPVAILKQGESPLVSVTPNIDPQNYYSHITGIEPTKTGKKGSKYTEKNPHLNGVIRPLSFTVPDTEDSDIKKAVKAKMGRMFGEAVTYSVNVSSWNTPNGEQWKKGDIIEITAPDAMIYKPYKFIIKSLDLNKDRASETAILTVTFPEVYSGEIPEVLPWDL